MSSSIPRMNLSRTPFSPPRASHGITISPRGIQVFLVAMEMPDWPARCHAGKPGRLATSVVSEECNGFPGTGVWEAGVAEGDQNSMGFRKISELTASHQMAAQVR